MASEKLYRKLRIFIASPNDVAPERERLRTVVEEFNRTGNIADYFGLTLEVLDWQTHVAPHMGRPQGVVFEQLPVDSWDVFVGVLWLRFGTPPGEVDPLTGTSYGSGTEEEFRVAYNCWRSVNRPTILVYRCIRVPQQLTDINPDQQKFINEFFAHFKADGRNPGLPRSFQLTEEFATRVRQDLTQLLLKYGDGVLNKKAPVSVIQTSAPSIPDTLPRRAPFFGRNREIAQALRALGPRDRGWGMVIDGVGGIGKTALAVELAHLCKERALFEAFVFVTLKQDVLTAGTAQKNLAATTLDDLINRAARAFGQPGIEKITDSAEKREAFFDALSGRRVLLIFDNLETLTINERNAIGDYLRDLPLYCKAVVTSRERSGEAAASLRLESLPWGDARQLIVDQVARNSAIAAELSRVPEEGWRRLYDETGGSPLMLIWMLGLIGTRGWTFEHALDLLRGGGDELDLSEFIFGAARTVMDPGERVALGALSLFEGAATFEALAATSELNEDALHVALERLRAVSLVDVAEEDEERTPAEARYLLLPLAKRFAFDDLLSDADLLAGMQSRFVCYWVDYASRHGGDDEERYKSFGLLEAEWVNLETAAGMLREIALTKDGRVADAGAARRLIALADDLKNFIFFTGRWEKYVQLLSWGYYAAIALDERITAGRFAGSISWSYYERQLAGEASEWSKKISEAYAGTGSEEHYARGLAFEGMALYLQKKYDESESLTREALGIWRKLNTEQWVAFALTNLAEIKGKQEKYDEAVSYNLEALEVLRRHDFKEGLAACSVNLGFLELKRLRWAEAEKWLRDSLRYAREIGRADVIANAQHGLAKALAAQGQPDAALPLAREALITMERLRYPEAPRVRELIEGLTQGTG